MAEACSQDLILVIEDEWFTVNTTKKATDNKTHKFESALTIGLKKKGARLSSAATSAGVYEFSRRPRLDMHSHRGDSREHVLWRRQDRVFIRDVKQRGARRARQLCGRMPEKQVQFPLQDARSHQACVWLVMCVSRLLQAFSDLSVCIS